MWVEIDMDGVALDIHGPLAEELKQITPNFKLDWICSWSLSELPAPLTQKAHQLFKEASFIGRLQPYPNAVPAMEKLKAAGHFIAVNTSVCSEECVAPRKVTVASNFGHLADRVQVTTFGSKPMLDGMDASIDDHIGNLYRSTSPLRILVTQHHNRFMAAPHILDCKSPWDGMIKRADSLEQAIEYILNIDGGTNE